MTENNVFSQVSEHPTLEGNVHSGEFEGREASTITECQEVTTEVVPMGDWINSLFGTPEREAEEETLDDTEKEQGWEPFPIDCLPPVLYNYCLTVAKSTNTDPAFTAASVLPITASAIGAHIVAQMKDDWKVPAIIWALTVANSGSGKTPAWGMAVKPLVQAQRHLNKQYDEETKGIPAKSKPGRPFVHISNTTPAALFEILGDNPFGICASYNEAVAWLEKCSGDMLSLFNEIFDGGYLQVNRKTGKKLIVVDHSHCSVAGGIQPGVLGSILQKNPQLLTSGFCTRMN